MNEKPEASTFPSFRAVASPEEILDLLRSQENKGKRLLNKAFLSIEDVRNWNLLTQKILTKAFGSDWDYIHSIIYAGEQKHYPAFEPESSLEKKRRNNFQLALKMLQGCMEQMNPAKPASDSAEGEVLRKDPQGAKTPPQTIEQKEEKVVTIKNTAIVEESGVKDPRKVLLLHGSDEEKKELVIDFLKNLDLEPVLTGNGSGPGGKGIEAFEADPSIVFVLVLLDAEEYGYPKGQPDQEKPRAAQKLLFELGYMMGKLKNLVCALYEEGLDFPFEYKGEIFVPMDSGGLWKLIVARAMKMAEVEVDLNKAI